MTDRKKRRMPRLAEIREIARRMTPDADILGDLSRDGLRRWIAKEGRCECGCGQAFEDVRVEYDHVIPNAMLFPDDDEQFQALRPDCHREKTRRDVAAIAKTKRMQGLTGQRARRARAGGSRIKSSPKIAGRGFDKRLTRGFDGKVRART